MVNVKSPSIIRGNLRFTAILMFSIYMDEFLANLIFKNGPTFIYSQCMLHFVPYYILLHCSFFNSVHYHTIRWDT